MEDLQRIVPLLEKLSRPGAMERLKDGINKPGPIIGGLLGEAFLRDYVNPYLSQYGTKLDIGNKTINYSPNDAYEFSLGEEYGYPKLGMKVKF